MGKELQILHFIITLHICHRYLSYNHKTDEKNCFFRHTFLFSHELELLKNKPSFEYLNLKKLSDNI